MRFDQKLREQIEKELAQFPVQRASAEKYAAVALIVTAAGIDPDISGIPAAENRQHDAALLLTRRSASLKRHAGQWALPGGRIDPGETEMDAARREAVEEIGLSLGTDHYLGQLDDYVTRSGYVMTPLVFWIDGTTQLVLNPDEVASVHRIPVSEFLREDAPMLDYDELAEQHDTTNKRPVLRMPVGDNWIAAPTAAILYQFREVCLLNRHTRVAHFEQPVFAWS